MLKNGRFLVIEYKGTHLSNDDSKEKKALGELWSMRSNSASLFVRPMGKGYTSIQRVITSK